MNFNTIDENLSLSQIEKATNKFNQFLCYLAIRADNQHCFGIKGGNNYQLILLADYTHHLIGDSKLTIIRSSTNVLYWNADYVIYTSLDKLREAVDQCLCTVHDNDYAMGALFNCISANDIKQSLPHPLINKLIPYPSLVDVASFTWQNRLILAVIICDDIRNHIDKLPLPNGQIVLDEHKVMLLVAMDPEIAILSIRWRIGIERLIKFNLDMHPSFSIIIDRINRLVT